MTPGNTLIIKTALKVAQEIGAHHVVIHCDPLDDLKFKGRIPSKLNLILVSRKKRFDGTEEKRGSLLSRARTTIALPRVQMTRIALIKVTMTLALSKEIVSPGDKVVFAVGQTEGGELDLIHIVDTARESEIITGRGLAKVAEVTRPEVFQAVLNLTAELADKGREGKPIGTIFVLGDHERVMQLSKQMIMNPFKGYDEDERDVLGGGLKETIREFSAMDGAFIISDDGTVLAAGRFLGAAVDESILPRGLGSRHIAAAGITSLTKAIAFVISESSGDVRIFKDGRIVMHIEKSTTKK